MKTDQQLANEWRAGVDKNLKLAQELIDRGYSFRCLEHDNGLKFHEGKNIEIIKQETVKL